MDQVQAPSLPTPPRSTFNRLTKFHAGYFRISLSLSSQSLLWKILSDPSSTSYPHPFSRLFSHLLPSAAFLTLWSLSLLSLILISSLFLIRCFFHFSSVRAEFNHRVGVNYLFAPWICLLLLLQSNPFINAKSSLYIVLWWLFSVPILVMDVKIYGQWFTKGKRFLSVVANPTSQISVFGNLVGARAAAQMGFKENINDSFHDVRYFCLLSPPVDVVAICMFALGISHYLVLFVTLYQRFLGGDSLPTMLRPVFFLFFAVPSMASVAWYSINSKFDTPCKMLFFLSLFLFASLVSRPALFKRSMRRFNVAWWAYSFPLTILALAATRYAQEVKASLANVMMLILSMLSVIVTFALLAFTVLKSSDILPHEVDMFLSSTNSSSVTLPVTIVENTDNHPAVLQSNVLDAL